GAFRSLRVPGTETDFSSNDYLGIVRNDLLQIPGVVKHGSTGSRLLTGNSVEAGLLEDQIAAFHSASAALLFNSGYDANIGLLSSVIAKGETVIYDFLSHASIRDGIRLSNGTAFSFVHNDLNDLERRLTNATSETRQNIFVVTESVFSMDGDIAPLKEIADLCDKYKAHLIVDEAHATGVAGPAGAGVIQELGIQDQCFARVHTFGKAVGTHGAVVLGSQTLKDYLVNFSRALIYTTALPQSAIRAIAASYQLFPAMEKEREHLSELISYFQQSKLRYKKLTSGTPIQAVIIPGNDAVKQVSETLRNTGLDVRPILYPTVPKGSERLRIIIHSFNTIEELKTLVQHLI
ncbi:MAG: 8-amino-7-oxononanoate synthase, partial [Chitinophagaceae bacterium]